LTNSCSAWDLSVRQSLTTLFRVHYGFIVRDRNNIRKSFDFALDALFDIKAFFSVVVNNITEGMAHARRDKSKYTFVPRLRKDCHRERLAAAYSPGI
jgi:hypothetical protein